MLVLFVWIGALVVAGVILGFCAYEVSWKSGRFKTDLDKLNALTSDLTALHEQAAATQLRMIEARR